MRPLNFAILKYLTTVDEACPEDIIEALKGTYGTFRALNKKDILSALMTAEVNGLVQESRFELDENGELRIYYRAHEEGPARRASRRGSRPGPGTPLFRGRARCPRIRPDVPGAENIPTLARTKKGPHPRSLLHRCGNRPYPCNRRHRAVRTASKASSPSMRRVPPAALRWPPPPNCTATERTSVVPVDRRLSL